MPGTFGRPAQTSQPVVHRATAKAPTRAAQEDGLGVELVLVRQHDLPEIGEAALKGDAIAAGLWRAVESFERGCFAKGCIFCERPFRLQCSPVAYWVSDRVAIGLCANCAAKPDRQLRRIIKKYEIER